MNIALKETISICLVKFTIFIQLIFIKVEGHSGYKVLIVQKSDTRLNGELLGD
jgi:uncharacterized membrane protein